MRRPVIGSERLFRGTREQRLRRFKMIPVRFLLPNIITLLALCSGVTAIRLGIEGRFELAVGAVIIAVVLDAIDGRLARLLKGSSRFGAELDSLADFVNFGVAPAILVYIWSLHQLRNLGWIVALGLAICCALRLARFNVAIDDPDKPAWKMNFFVGIPAPAGAGLAMAPLYLGFLGLVPDGRAAAGAGAGMGGAGCSRHGQPPTDLFRQDAGAAGAPRSGAADHRRRRAGTHHADRLHLGNALGHCSHLCRLYSFGHKKLSPPGAGLCRPRGGTGRPAAMSAAR